MHTEHTEFITKLRESEKTIIVEGKKDQAALEDIGVEGAITISGPLYAFIERIASMHKDVVILTDLDPTGRRLFATLARGLRERGVRVDTTFREYLFKHTSLRQIEGIRSLAKLPDFQYKNISRRRTARRDEH